MMPARAGRISAGVPARRTWLGGFAFLQAFLCLFHAASGAEAAVLRVGYFPNLTHAHGLVGSHATRSGQGWFESRMGGGMRLEWFAFNAGPSAMEAILAGTIDVSYVGPNPAINAYIRSRGRDIRVLAGAVEGGSALVVAGDGRITGPADLKGRRIATPQLGNTQDVAARAWLRAGGLRVTLSGGDVQVVPTANPDQLALFRQRKLDAVWTVEPWVSRLEMEAGGRVLMEQPDALTTILVAGVRVWPAKAELVDKFIAAHRELTRWLGGGTPEARERVRTALSAELRRQIPAELVDSAWRRMRFTDRVEPSQFTALVADAQKVGFLRNAIPLDELFSRKP